MDLDSEFELEHLLFKERKCRVCGEKKNLLEDFYLTRKNRKPFASSYSYECKQCATERVKKRSKRKYRLGTCDICGATNTKLLDDICVRCSSVIRNNSIDTLEKIVVYLRKNHGHD